MNMEGVDNGTLIEHTNNRMNSQRMQNEDVSKDISGQQDVTRKKHRRKKARHRKPYSRMSWDERRILDDLETKRANEKREKQFHAGQPMAPYNTTQFIMESHEADELAHNGNRPFIDGSGSSDTSDGDEMPDEDFHDKEFEETYDNCHAERLQSLTKDELIRELLCLESKLGNMEKILKDRGIDLPHVNTTWTASESFDCEKSHILFCGSPEYEVSSYKKLKDENDILKKEIIQLRREYIVKNSE